MILTMYRLCQWKHQSNEMNRESPKMSLLLTLREIETHHFSSVYIYTFTYEQRSANYLVQIILSAKHNTQDR